MLLLASVIWGTTFVFQTTGMETLGPVGFQTARFLAGTLALLPFALYERRRNIHVENRLDRRRGVPALIGLALTMAIGSILQQIALGITSVANTAFLTTLYVLLVPIFGLLFFGRNIALIRWAAVAVFLVGSWLMTDASPKDAVAGDFLVLIGASLWAAHIMLVGWLVQKTSAPFQLAFIQTAATAALSGAALPFVETITLAAIIPALPEILYAGVLSTAFAFTLQLIAQKRTSNAAASILLSLEGVVAAFFGWILIGQTMAMVAIFGAGLIFIAVILIEVSPEHGNKAP
jgi:drug/metabolite transporter (DMT)-like permease